MESAITALNLIADGASWLLLLLGSFLVLVSGIGLVRMPDFYTRLHPAGITDTLAAACILIGLALQVAPGVVTIKLLLILIFLLVTGPVSSHAMAGAALAAGLKPFGKSREADIKSVTESQDVDPPASS